MYICANRSISNTVFIPHTYTSQLYVHDSNSDVCFDFKEIIFYSCVHKDHVYLIMQMLIVTDFNFFLQIYSFLFKELRKGAIYFAIKQILSRISKKSLLILELSRLKSFVAGIPTLLLQMFCYSICNGYVHTTYLVSVRWSW